MAPKAFCERCERSLLARFCHEARGSNPADSPRCEPGRFLTLLAQSRRKKTTAHVVLGGVRWRIPNILRTITAGDVLDLAGAIALVYTLGQASKVIGVSKQRILAAL